MATLAQLKGRAEAARDRFESQRGQLFRPDGSRVYTDAEHEERLAALRSERNAALDDVEEAVRTAFEQANANLAALENASVLGALSEKDLERAQGAYTLAVAELEGVRNRDERLARLRSVHHRGVTGDRVAFLLAARASGATREAGVGDPEISALLDELESSVLGDGHSQQLEAARQSIREAGEVRGVCWLARREQTHAYTPQYSVPGR